VFLLEKWYGDVVTNHAAGVGGAILYAARLRWGPLRVGYGATLTFGAGTPRTESRVRRVAMPTIDASAATWRNTALDVEATWCRDAEPIAARLVDGADGSIQWTCHMPRARARVRRGAVTVLGLGYVEQLRLTIPPARWPFRGGTLRWGRYLSPAHTLIWIAWTGRDPRRWVWLDGVPQPDLDTLDGGQRLVLHERHAIRDEPLLTTIGIPLPELARRLSRTLGAARECKHLSRASLMNGAGATDTGWAIHEEVQW
jgi:hypothetical protein